MDNTNKPQWLIDAENEINQFAETKLGKMSQEEFQFFERQSNAGKSGGSKTASDRLKSGYFQSEEWKKAQRKGAKTAGNNNVKSGHWAKVAGVHGNAASHAEIQCPICGCKGSIRNIKPTHFDNCRYPIIKKHIESCLPSKDQFPIKELIYPLMEVTGFSHEVIMIALKRFFLIHGPISTRYQEWKYEPVSEGEGFGPRDY